MIVSIILIRYAEIGLKSRPVRTRFERQLKDNIVFMLSSAGIEALVRRENARLYVETDRIEQAILVLKRVFGIASLSVAEVCTSAMEDLCAKAATYSIGRIRKGQSFAVCARREGQQPYSSIDVGREVGAAILMANCDKGIRVNLGHPDVSFFIEVRDRKAYLFTSYVYCHAGLPLGSQGSVLAEVDDDRGVLSAWLMMKRGCRVYIRGQGDLSLLRNYDHRLKVAEALPTGRKAILGYVLGTRASDIRSVDVTKYGLPVFFPTIGMTDGDVRAYLDRLVWECPANSR